jgi:hypothetical protein
VSGNLQVWRDHEALGVLAAAAAACHARDPVRNISEATSSGSTATPLASEQSRRRSPVRPAATVDSRSSQTLRDDVVVMNPRVEVGCEADSCPGRYALVPRHRDETAR